MSAKSFSEFARCQGKSEWNASENVISMWNTKMSLERQNFKKMLTLTDPSKIGLQKHATPFNLKFLQVR